MSVVFALIPRGPQDLWGDVEEGPGAYAHRGSVSRLRNTEPKNPLVLKRDGGHTNLSMLDYEHSEFYILGARFHCISLNSVGLCFSMPITYM